MTHCEWYGKTYDDGSGSMTLRDHSDGGVYHVRFNEVNCLAVKIGLQKLIQARSISKRFRHGLRTEPQGG